MQISPDQGALLQFIIKSSNIQNCLEIGTFTGYSALTMALALPENGSIVSLDIDKVNTDIAKKYWSKHSVGKKIDFIHIFGFIMEGRTTIQKSNLSKTIVSSLNIMFPEVPIISININDFEKASYFNKTML